MICRSLLACLCTLFVAGALTACNSEAINKDARDPFLTSDDLEQMTDLMAEKITSDPKVAELTRDHPIVIVLEQIKNDTNQIITSSQKEMYVHRIRILLASKPALQNHFTFVLNRADFEALQKKQGVSPAELGVPADRLQPEYVLTGTFYAHTTVSNAAKTRDDYYYCTYRLTAIKPGNTAGLIPWESAYKTRKQVTKDIVGGID